MVHATKVHTASYQLRIAWLTSWSSYILFVLTPTEDSLKLIKVSLTTSWSSHILSNSFLDTNLKVFQNRAEIFC